MAERLEGGRSDLAVVGAVRVVAPSVREFHDVSPPDRDDTTIGRSRLTDTLDGFHSIRIQHRYMTFSEFVERRDAGARSAPGNPPESDGGAATTGGLTRGDH